MKSKGLESNAYTGKGEVERRVDGRQIDRREGEKVCVCMSKYLGMCARVLIRGNTS